MVVSADQDGQSEFLTGLRWRVGLADEETGMLAQVVADTNERTGVRNRPSTQQEYPV